MQKWKCRKCGYVYDPAKGAPGVKVNTEFEDVREDFKCPVCDADKHFFRKMRN